MTPHQSDRRVPAPLPRRDFLRVLGIGAAAAAVAPALASCSRAPEQSGEGGGSDTFTIYWNAGHVYQAYSKLIDAFAEEHDVKVNWQKFQWEDLTTKLQADLASGQVPDLVEYAGGNGLMPLALTGDVLALDPYLEKDGKSIGYPDDWQAQSIEPWQHEGSTYGVQLHLTCNQLYYNKKMFSAADITKPPTTWDELVSVAKKLTGNGKHGIALNQDYTYSYPWLLQNGVEAYDAKTKTVLDPHDAALEAMRFQYDLVHRHKVSPVPTPSSDYSGPQRLLSAKRVAMILTGPWDIKPIRDGSPDVDLGLALPLTHEKRGTHFAGSGVMIPKKAKHADLAWDLIKRMTALDVELQVTKEAGMTMPRKSWAEAKQVTSDPLLDKVAEALSYGTDWWRALAPTGKGPKIEDSYKTFYQSVVLKGTKPEQAMSTFLSATKKALG